MKVFIYQFKDEAEKHCLDIVSLKRSREQGLWYMPYRLGFDEEDLEQYEAHWVNIEKRPLNRSILGFEVLDGMNHTLFYTAYVE